MTELEAIKARHSVRKYTDKPIETTKVATLRAEVEKLNAESGLNIQLVLDEPKCFSTGMWKYGQFSGVNNYFVMAGPKGKEAEEKIDGRVYQYRPWYRQIPLRGGCRKG